ncbi:antibiotic biosynthesis monooxygenase [Ammonicoccus fulvus]|uniref:Antibiotic biosynthesis monooxygenase n=1 Tax=Ammonicoccus fulvus TaxID=3138240 RepID=A0ABZ3FR00_9ACTN
MDKANAQADQGVQLSGFLRCATDDEVAIVAEHLPRHIELTRAELGCLSFEVIQTEDPRVWSVEEWFTGSDAFRAHQARVIASEWGRATQGIERDYAIVGLE